MKRKKPSKSKRNLSDSKFSRQVHSFRLIKQIVMIIGHLCLITTLTTKFIEQQTISLTIQNTILKDTLHQNCQVSNTKSINDNTNTNSQKAVLNWVNPSIMNNTINKLALL